MGEGYERVISNRKNIVDNIDNMKQFLFNPAGNNLYNHYLYKSLGEEYNKLHDRYMKILLDYYTFINSNIYFIRKKVEENKKWLNENTNLTLEVVDTHLNYITIIGLALDSIREFKNITVTSKFFTNICLLCKTLKSFLNYVEKILKTLFIV